MHRISFYEFRSAFGNTSLESGGDARCALGAIFKELAATPMARDVLVESAVALSGISVKATPASARKNLAAGTGDEELAWAFYYWLHCKVPENTGISAVDIMLLGEPFERFTGYAVSAGEIRESNLALFAKTWAPLVSSPRFVRIRVIVSTSICLLLVGALYFATNHQEPDLAKARHLNGPAGETGDAEGLDEKLDAILRALESDHGVPYRALKSAARKFGDEHISTDELPKKLSEWADRYVELERIVQEWIGDGPELTALRNTASVKLDVGDLEGAQTAIEQAIRTLQNIQKGSIRKEAELTAQRADILSLRFLYLEAASEFARAVELAERAGEPSNEYTSSQAWNLIRATETKSGLLATERATALLEAMIAKTDKSTDYPDWVNLNIHLARIYGRASQHSLDPALGEKRLNILEMLDKNVSKDSLYRDAIDVDLANAYLILGQEKGNVQLIEKSISTYERLAAQSKASGDNLNWGYITHNRAEALGYIASITGSIDDHRAAIEAWRSSLQGITREDAPDDHWTTVGYLVTALVALHYQSGDQALLAEAEKLAKERVAYSVVHRDRDLLSWAAASRDLGEVYLAKAEGADTPEGYADALRQFEAALTVLSEQISQSMWIHVNYLAATAAHQLADLYDPIKYLDIAASHLLAAKGTLRKNTGDVDLGIFKIELTLATTYAKVGQITKDINYLNRASQLLNDLLIIVDSDDFDKIIFVKFKLAENYMNSANINRSNEYYDKAIDLYRDIESLAIEEKRDEFVIYTRRAIAYIEKIR